MDAIIRGDIVTIATQGDFGKPRPALVIQANQFCEHRSVTVALITGTVIEEAPFLRVTLLPSEKNGLQKPSQVMVDKVVTVKRDKIGSVIGYIDKDALAEVDRCLAVFLGIVK